MKRLRLALIIFWSAAAVVLVGVLAYFAVAGVPSASRFSRGGDYELLLDHSASPAQVETLRLELSAEDVELRLSDDGDIHIRQYGHNLPDDRILQVTHSGNTLTLSRKRRISLFNFGHAGSRVEVSLPEGYEKALDIHLTAGELRFLDDFSLSRLNIELSAGDIISDGALTASRAGITVTSGELNLAELRTGDYALSVSAGDVTVCSLTGSGEVKVTSGEVSLNRVTLDGSLRVQVTAGDVSIGLAKDAAFAFTGKATAGDIDTYFGVHSDGAQNRNLQATVGNAPSASLHVEATAGNVTIFEAD